MKRVVVLYEDSALEGSIKNYGPHQLVLQCIADVSDVPAWELKRFITAHPANSNSKVQAECRRVPPAIGTDGSPVVAVYDEDKAYKLPGLARNLCKTQMRQILLHQTSLSALQLSIVFLEQNLESVLKELHICAPGLTSPATWQKALQKKLMAREVVLEAASRPSPTGEAARAELLRRMPSLSYLAWRVACAALSP